MSLRTDTRSNWTIDILMYHSISDAGGPTSIPEPVFKAQMDAIAASGKEVISLGKAVERLTGADSSDEPAIVLTFDDGFRDFATAAWPIIHDHGWTATVFLPTGHIGGAEGWQGSADPPRPLMDWQEISQLAAAGALFESHTVNHPDLTDLDDASVSTEITRCKEIISEKTGIIPNHIAPPYGLANDKVRQAIALNYQSSCGTRLGRMGPKSDRYDLPRLEMFYFTNINRWRAHLDGRGATYLATRKTLRKVRDVVSKPWMRK